MKGFVFLLGLQFIEGMVVCVYLFVFVKIGCRVLCYVQYAFFLQVIKFYRMLNKVCFYEYMIVFLWFYLEVRFVEMNFFLENQYSLIFKGIVSKWNLGC